MPDGWRWCAGSVNGFGDCMFEVEEKLLLTSLPERIMVRRLTSMRPVPTKDPGKAEMKLPPWVMYPFGVFDLDDEISVMTSQILAIGDASEAACKAANEAWNPSNVVIASKAQLDRIEGANNARKGFGLIS